MLSRPSMGILRALQPSTKTMGGEKRLIQFWEDGCMDLRFGVIIEGDLLRRLPYPENEPCLNDF